MTKFRVIVTVVLLAGLLYALWQRDPFPLDSIGATDAAYRIR